MSLSLAAVDSFFRANPLALQVGAGLVKTTVMMSIVMLIGGLILSWVERKQSAIMQDRIGANRADILGIRAMGIVHNLADRGAVWVTSSVRPEGVALTVENTGEELTPESVATLGEPFLRGSERVRTDHAGVGLGLAIVKSIAQAHDGTLTLTPRPAGGLRVTVQLPAAPPRETRRAESAADPASRQVAVPHSP